VPLRRRALCHARGVPQLRRLQLRRESRRASLMASWIMSRSALVGSGCDCSAPIVLGPRF
jgi:hypothetical protein